MPYATQQTFEQESYNEFKYHLDKAIEAMYNCRMENNGAVLTLTIKDLYSHLQSENLNKD